MKYSYKLILTYWVCLARPSQSTHNSLITFRYFTGVQSCSMLLVSLYTENGFGLTQGYILTISLVLEIL